MKICQIDSLKNTSELQQKKRTLENNVATASKQVNELVHKYPQLQFDYTSPDRNFDRSRVKGLVADLFSIPDTQYAMALEVAAGVFWEEVILIVLCWGI